MAIAAVAALLLAAVPTACSRQKAVRDIDLSTSVESAEAVKSFGYGPRPGPHVTYRPDVIIIGGGADAIRGLSDDGTTWTIDGSAKGASDLRIGKIMFATSRAIGRVVAIERRGGDLAVVLAPVALTEVVRDAQITVDVKLAPGAFAMHESQAPSPSAYLMRPDTGAGAAMPAVWYSDSDQPSLDATALKTSPKISVGEWEFEPYFKYSSREWYQENDNPGSAPLEGGQKEERQSAALGLKIQRKLLEINDKKRIKFGGDFRIVGADVRIRGHLSIADGKVQEPVTFVLEGVDALDIGLLGGVENGNDDNVKLRAELPADLAFGIPGELPLAVHLKFKALIETAFSGANSTLWASGRYKLDGPIGIVDGTPVGPVVAVQAPMVTNIHGIALGASGIVGAVEFRFMFGVGGDYFVAGPYGKLTVAVGVSRGSLLTFAFGGPLASPLRPPIDCRGVTLKADVGAGIGVYIDSKWKSFLDKLQLKTDSEIAEKSVTVFNTSVYQPQSALCQDR